MSISCGPGGRGDRTFFRMGRGQAWTSRLLFIACGTTLLLPCLPDTHPRPRAPLRLSQARSCDGPAASPAPSGAPSRGMTRLGLIGRHQERIAAIAMGGGDSGVGEQSRSLVDSGGGLTRERVHALRLRGGHRNKSTKNGEAGYVGGKSMRPDRQKRSHRPLPPHPCPHHR